MNVFTKRRFGFDDVTTRTSSGNLSVFWMNVVFHGTNLKIFAMPPLGHFKGGYLPSTA